MVAVAADTDFKQTCSTFFKNLQREICNEFTRLDGQGQFDVQPWKKQGESGLFGEGLMCTMESEVFEKVGVNFSSVYGNFSENFRKEIPGTEQNEFFWASGISLVSHMKSPLVPTTHMNLRHIVTEKSWFGGGADLTPFLPFEEDTELFHQKLKKACENYRKGSYQQMKEDCDTYFYLPHRKETRGVGGIFFDNLFSGNREHDFEFLKQVGYAFLEAYSAIVSKRKDLPWTQEQKETQLVRRGRYVEFNLLYDRGTRFGLETGGFPEAILMSMPPEVKWPVETIKNS